MIVYSWEQAIFSVSMHVHVCCTCNLCSQTYLGRIPIHGFDMIADSVSMLCLNEWSPRLVEFSEVPWKIMRP